MSQVSIKYGHATTDSVKTYSHFRIEQDEDGAFFGVTNASRNRGVMSREWSEHLLASLNSKKPIDALSFDGLVNDNWENFYDWVLGSTDLSVFERNKFEEEGSLASFAGVWLNQDGLTFFSEGDSYILIYNSEADELFTPYGLDDFRRWIGSVHKVNWRHQKIDEKYEWSRSEPLGGHENVIVCDKGLAKLFIINYLIIQSKDDAFLGRLESLMEFNDELSQMIYQNKDSFKYDSFDELLDEWKEACESTTAYRDKLDSLIQGTKLQVNDTSLIIASSAKDETEVDYAFESNCRYYDSAVGPIGKTSISSKNQLSKSTSTIVTPVKHEDKISHSTRLDASGFIDKIVDEGISKLYHFTDLKNIDSIIEHGGLLSWKYCEDNGIAIPRQGGNELSRILDCRKNLENYVRLSFCSLHPMMYIAMNEKRISDPVILEIDPIIVSLDSTLFTDRNANRTNCSIGGELDDLNKVHFNTVKERNHFNLNQEEAPYYQAEVLIKQFLPVKYILNINDFK